jgi:hypothetical protein
MYSVYYRVEVAFIEGWKVLAGDQPVQINASRQTVRQISRLTPFQIVGLTH